MGHQSHPTTDVSDSPETVYSVVDRRDSYHSHTVAKFSTESAAEELKEQLVDDQRHSETARQERWFVVRESPVFQSVDEYENYDPLKNNDT